MEKDWRIKVKETKEKLIDFRNQGMKYCQVETRLRVNYFFILSHSVFMPLLTEICIC